MYDLAVRAIVHDTITKTNDNALSATRQEITSQVVQLGRLVAMASGTQCKQLCSLAPDMLHDCRLPSFTPTIYRNTAHLTNTTHNNGTTHNSPPTTTTNHKVPSVPEKVQTPMIVEPPESLAHNPEQAARGRHTTVKV